MTPSPVSTQPVAPAPRAAAAVADVALQRVADASVWLIFRINGVRS